MKEITVMTYDNNGPNSIYKSTTFYQLKKINKILSLKKDEPTK